MRPPPQFFAPVPGFTNGAHYPGIYIMVDVFLFVLFTISIRLHFDKSLGFPEGGFHFLIIFIFIFWLQ